MRLGGPGKFCLSPQLFLLGRPQGRTPILQTRRWRQSLSHAAGAGQVVGKAAPVHWTPGVWLQSPLP